MPPEHPNRNHAIIGGGLLRLLSDTIVLLYKTRHLYWSRGGAFDRGLEQLVCEEHTELNDLCNQVAREIVQLSVSIPADFAIFVRMSSIRFADTDQDDDINASLKSLSSDHRKIMADIETLSVTLPLEKSQNSAALLQSLTERHRRCVQNLEALVVHSDETAH